MASIKAVQHNKVSVVKQVPLILSFAVAAHSGTSCRLTACASAVTYGKYAPLTCICGAVNANHSAPPQKQCKSNGVILCKFLR